MPQNGKNFADWWPLLKEQADRCDWEGYNTKKAARDAMLYQANDKKLQKKIMAEDLTFEDTIKSGIALEQGTKKVNRINKNSKDDSGTIRRSLKTRSKLNKSSTSQSCRTYTRPRHLPNKCPGKEKECFDCKQKGHFKGSEACSKNKKKISKRLDRSTRSCPTRTAIPA